VSPLRVSPQTRQVSVGRDSVSAKIALLWGSAVLAINLRHSSAVSVPARISLDSVPRAVSSKV
jgi:hypothetical protein